METPEVLDVARETIWVTLLVGAPIMAVALIVGLGISLVQALTQIQEMTLSFVPKVIAIFLATVLFLPFMLRMLTTFTQQMAERIANGG
ncbi:MAG: flagellar biosynthesis protein FliQ [Alphaproteobacteria bacterium]